ncbi:unnamed protein product [Merluccius merluccius]
MTTIVHDTAEALCLCEEYNLYLKPTAKMTISVALPQLKLPGKSISNWEVMERLKAMVAPEQLSALRISKSTMDFIRFEGEVENKGLVKSLLSRLDGKSIKLSGFTDILKVRAVENKMDFPTRHDWDSFFRDAKDMNETLPGERPDTIHLEGLPCRWFSQKDTQHPDRPSEEVLATIFQGFGKVRNVDIPMLDPYREEMMDKNFNTFSFGGHLYFEAFVQYQEYHGFTKAMDTLRGMKLMLKGEDGKAMACNIKVTFDTSKHLSSMAVKQRSQERQKLQELERQREEQKRREKEEEEQRKEDERKQKEQEEEERERRREERVRKREQKVREREEKRNLKRVKRRHDEEQRKLQLKIATEERRLLLAQRNLESIRLIAELLARAKRQERARQDEERARLQRLEARRRQQEEELRRVEAEKERALELQRRERELREKLLGNLLKKSTGAAEEEEEGEAKAMTKDTQDPALLLGAGSAGGGSSHAVLVVQGNCLKVRKGGKPKKPVRSGVGSQGMEKKKAATEKRKGAEAERKRERRKEEAKTGRGGGRSSRERSRERRSPERERRSYSHGRRRRSRSSSSSRRRRRSSSRHRRSHSHRNDHRRSHDRRHRGGSSSSSNTSSSRYRSRSSSGRSYSRSRRSYRRSKSHRRRSRHGDSRSSSRSSSRSRGRRSYSHDNRYRRRSRDSRSRHR